MQVTPREDAYSLREIALAAGVPEADVVALVGPTAHVPYAVSYATALRIGRTLMRRERAMFSPAGSPSQSNPVPLVLSSTLHLGLSAAALVISTWVSVPAAATSATSEPPEPARLVFIATPGPGGGGGGGGTFQKAPPPKAKREGRRALSSPVPARVPPKPIEQAVAPPEPKPVLLDAEPLPMVVAPIVVAPADSRNRIGVLMDTSSESESHGAGRGGGAGSGTGTGLGDGDGSGIGPGSGGGIGGGPYRPGSGIEPPRLLREVKADYTEDARRRGLTGDVVLEIVVRRDGTVGDVRIVEGLGGGLNERAVAAVRQWRFAPARRQGAAVDVVVEVAVEFKLR